MTLPTDAGTWGEMLRESVEERDKHLDGYREQLSRYVGGAWKRGYATTGSDPENHAYQYVALMVGALAGGVPRPLVGTGRKKPGIITEADALQYGLWRWGERSRVLGVIEQLAVDYCLRYAVAMVTRAPAPGYEEAEDPPYWPQMRRLSLYDFAWDSQALDWESARFAMHRYVVDRSSIEEWAKEDETWNVVAIRAAESRRQERDRGRDSRTERENRWDRDSVVLWEVFVPEWRNEDGSRGALLTVHPDQGGEGFPRKPRKWEGYRSGPYHVFSAHYVPDEVIGLANPIATHAQAGDLNDHSKVIADSAARYKEIIVSHDPELTRIVNSGQHLYAYDLARSGDDIRKQVASLPLGGIHAEQIAYWQMAMERMDRASGIHDIQRGNIGQGTATAAAIAQSAYGQRTGFVVGKFVSGLEACYTKVAYHLWHDSEVKFPLGEEMSAEILGHPPESEDDMLEFTGGEPEGDFDDLDLHIDPLSVQRVTEESLHARFAAKLEFIGATAQLPVVAPWIDVAALYRDAARAFQDPGLADVYKADVAEQMAEEIRQQQGAGGGAPSGGQAPEARYGRGRIPATYPYSRSSGTKQAAGQKQVQSMAKQAERNGRSRSQTVSSAG